MKHDLTVLADADLLARKNEWLAQGWKDYPFIRALILECGEERRIRAFNRRVYEFACCKQLVTAVWWERGENMDVATGHYRGTENLLVSMGNMLYPKDLLRERTLASLTFATEDYTQEEENGIKIKPFEQINSVYIPGDWSREMIQQAIQKNLTLFAVRRVSGETRIDRNYWLSRLCNGVDL